MKQAVGSLVFTLLLSGFVFGQASFNTTIQTTDFSGEWTEIPHEMKVVTNRVRAGYLRKNGVPYSANTTMTEYYHRMTAPNGDVWLTVVAEITDPENLREPFVQSTHFKRLAANATFKPEACEAR